MVGNKPRRTEAGSFVMFLKFPLISVFLLCAYGCLGVPFEDNQGRCPKGQYLSQTAQQCVDYPDPSGG